MFELYNNLAELVKSTDDPAILKAYYDTQKSIRDKIKQLYGRGVSVVDLV